MKKFTVLALGLAFIGVLGFSGCTKECTCTQKVDGVVVSTSTIETKGKCSDSNVTQTTMGITQTLTCE